MAKCPLGSKVTGSPLKTNGKTSKPWSQLAMSDFIFLYQGKGAKSRPALKPKAWLQPFIVSRGLFISHWKEISLSHCLIWGSAPIRLWLQSHSLLLVPEDVYLNLYSGIFFSVFFCYISLITTACFRQWGHHIA